MKPRTGRAPGPPPPPRLYQVLWAVAVMGLSASRPPLCQQESIRLLGTFIEEMGNSSGDGTLYTPEDVTVCYADNLDCFYMELQVIQEEQEEHTEILSRLILRLDQLRRKLKGTSRISRHVACLPCLSHPEKPVKTFLKRLLELMQFHCSMGAHQQKAFCPTPVPGNATLRTQTTASSAASAVEDQQV
ncbi:uncharacterized protein PHA67_003222 isoform 1-T4 [Liasis olivaceus]